MIINISRRQKMQTKILRTTIFSLSKDKEDNDNEEWSFIKQDKISI